MGLNRSKWPVKDKLSRSNLHETKPYKFGPGYQGTILERVAVSGETWFAGFADSPHIEQRHLKSLITESCWSFKMFLCSSPHPPNAQGRCVPFAIRGNPGHGWFI